MTTNNTLDLTEEEILKTINAVAKELAPKFVFGYHTLSDIKQQCRVFALEALPKWDHKKSLPGRDHKRSLYTFLMVHVHYKLINFRRDKYFRHIKPCDTCPFYEKINDKCQAFQDKQECPLFQKWDRRNSTKKSLSNLEIIEYPDEIIEVDEDIVIRDVTMNENIDRINKHLKSNLRSDYLRLLGGAKIPRNRYEELKEELKRILNDGRDTEEI